MAKPCISVNQHQIMEFFIGTIFLSMIDAFKGGSNWSRATRI